jgi:hypothetical protein
MKRSGLCSVSIDALHDNKKPTTAGGDVPEVLRFDTHHVRPEMIPDAIDLWAYFPSQH